MNDISHTSDMLRQLQSLSIERTDSAPQRQVRVPERRRRKWPMTLLLGCILAGAAGGAWYKGVLPEGIMEQAAGLGEQWLPEFVLDGDWLPGFEGTEAAEPAPPARVAAEEPVAPAPVPVAPPAVVGSGYVVAERELILMPDFGGRLAQVLIETGDRFEAGQVIAVLDGATARTDFGIAEANLSMAEASLAEAEAAVEEARADHDRQIRLAERGSVAKTQAEAARFALVRAERTRDVAARQVEIARLGVARQQEVLDRHRIAAPFGGVVVKRHLNPGDIAVSALDGGPGQGIATLIDPMALTIEVDVAETNLSRITAGQGADVVLDAWPGRSFRATVRTVAPKVSIQKGTVLVRLTFDTPPMGVFANMAAKVTFDPAEQTAELQQKGN